MTNEQHQATREEKAFGRLRNEKELMLSEAACTIFEEAEGAAYLAHLSHHYCIHPREYLDSMKKMHLAAAELTDRDRELLKELWRAALAAAASIDPDDCETFAGYRVYSGRLHDAYRMLSGVIEDTLQEDATQNIKALEEDLARWEAKVRHQTKTSELDPEDFADFPF